MYPSGFPLTRGQQCAVLIISLLSTVAQIIIIIMITIIIIIITIIIIRLIIIMVQGPYHFHISNKSYPLFHGFN